MDQKTVGVLYGLAAYLWWGLAPVYFKAVAAVPAMEVLAHRVVWSVVLLAALVALTRHWGIVAAALGDRRTLAMLLLSTLFISINWGTFIWAVMAERVLEVSLGYYINPLVNVLLGVLVLKESLSRWQIVAVLLAAAAVLNLAVNVAGLPWPSLVLAFSFSIYGLIRKTTALGSVDGLFLETAIVAPVALGYLLLLGSQGEGSFLAVNPGLDLLLFLAGVVTAAPLIWFASAARRLNYSTIGLLQYITPTAQFLLAVLVFGEVFTLAHGTSFACIWLALAIYSTDTLNSRRRARRMSAPSSMR
ncbi:MAG: EamA family transporter RarD [Rhodovibrionaceae bacterium]|nr:EamA family transporter RarD [Rhodovibrionaceae bacterium]